MPDRRASRAWVVAGVAAGLVALAVYGWTRRSSVDGPTTSRSGAERTRAPGGWRTNRVALDVGKYRAWQRTWVARARALTRGRDRPIVAAPPTVRRPIAGLLMEPACVLGPGELCASVADLVSACEDGDGASCLAVGQHLSDLPPRPLVAHSFFWRGCELGDDLACARQAQIKDAMRDGAAPIACEQDLFLCAWQAYRRRDERQLDEACALGVADACALMVDASSTDPDRARAYLEAACQLGNPMTCEELGGRLAGDCVHAADRPCYPPDPAEAAKALAIACEAGREAACR